MGDGQGGGEGDELATDSLANLPTPGTGRRGLSAEQRRRASEVLAGHYLKGASIRSLADGAGYSVARVRELLQEAGVTLRRRGGLRRSTNSEGYGGSSSTS